MFPDMFLNLSCYLFIVNVVSENDSFKERREKIRNYIYEYHDANSSKRLAELLGL